MTHLRSLTTRLAATLLATALLALAATALADHESMYGTGYGYDPMMQSGYGYGMPAMPMGAGFDPMNPASWTGVNDPMVGIQMLQQQADAAYQQSVQNYNTAVAQERKLFIDYYRQNTGDTATPDDAAYNLGYQLYCSRNPVDCQVAAQQNQAWAQQSQQRHQQNMAQLDANHNAWMAGQAGQDQAHQNFVQGVIWEQSTFTNPQTGQSFSLPNSPQPGTAYGNGVTWNPTTGTWSQTGAGGWTTPLSPGN